MFGCNDNPSARQLESAWKKLLGQHQINASESANCIGNDFNFLSVLNASSRKPEMRAINSNDWLPKCINTEHNASTTNNNILFENDFGDSYMDEGDHLIAENSDSFNIQKHIAAYLAAVLEKCIIEGRWYSPIKCQECLIVFSEDEMVDDDFVKLKMKTSKLFAPAKSTVEICEITEKAMRKFNYEAGKFIQIKEYVLSNLNMNDLYWASDFDGHTGNDHKACLVKLIIEMYVKKKQDYINRCNTLAAHETLWRSLLKKLVHFRGQ